MAAARPQTGMATVGVTRKVAFLYKQDQRRFALAGHP